MKTFLTQGAILWVAGVRKLTLSTPVQGVWATRRLANMMEVSYCLFGGSFMHLSLMYYLF